MSDDKKDKVIYLLAVLIIALLAKSFFQGSLGNFLLKDKEVEILEDPSAQETIGEDLEDEKVLEKKAYITGEIRDPGVYIVSEDDRLEDLINMAGGLTENANDKNLNLALKIEDQMKVYIPNINEDIENLEDDSINLSGDSNELVNINTADKNELMTLPNVGEKRAEAIINYRKDHRFESIEDIKNVTGIGDKFFESLKDLITV